jgi:hypothetical protein
LKRSLHHFARCAPAPRGRFNEKQKVRKKNEKTRRKTGNNRSRVIPHHGPVSNNGPASINNLTPFKKQPSSRQRIIIHKSSETNNISETNEC